MDEKALRDVALNEHFNTFAVLKVLDQRVTQQGKPYIAVTISDQTGEISGMKWDVTADEVAQLKAGQVVAVSAVRQEYKEKPQLKIISIRPTRDTEPQNPADFMPAAPMKKAIMEEEVSELVFKIVNPTWNRIVRYLLKEYQDAFYQFPAAKSNHHAFTGGLAFHTLSISRLAQAVANQYEDIDESLLYAGALLHDLGKVIELSGPVATTYTRAGNLLGHITLIDEQIVLAANEMKIDLFSEDMVLLRHVVLSHHGQLEWGSPVRPLVKEAQILHLLDELDANLQSFDKALADTKPGEFSQKVFALDGRMVYRPEDDHK